MAVSFYWRALIDRCLNRCEPVAATVTIASTTKGYWKKIDKGAMWWWFEFLQFKFVFFTIEFDGVVQEEDVGIILIFKTITGYVTLVELFYPPAAILVNDPINRYKPWYKYDNPYV